METDQEIQHIIDDRAATETKSWFDAMRLAFRNARLYYGPHLDKYKFNVKIDVHFGPQNESALIAAWQQFKKALCQIQYVASLDKPDHFTRSGVSITVERKACHDARVQASKEKADHEAEKVNAMNKVSETPVAKTIVPVTSAKKQETCILS